jgi:glutamate-1-semialdehyde 2,1-aminomutase
MNRPESEAAFRRASAVSPGGVHSPVRAFRAVGGTPVFVASASGSHVTDVDGNRYVDLCMSWGPLILGHAHPAVVRAVQAAAEKGLSFGACHRGEAELCEAILAGYPDFHRVRLVSSGTEAVMTALRLARAATGRRLVVKFDGGYHGHSDALLVRAGSGLATLGTASSAGVPAEVAALTLVAPLDDSEAVRALFAAHGRDIACVVVEPVPANNGLLVLSRDFLVTLRELCDASGALLLFDEVVTGFRFRYGGAGPLVGVRPDFVTLGKIVGGGMPIGAVAGPAALLDLLAPQGGVYQAGTLSGNPVSVAAGLATLARLMDGVAYGALEELGARLEQAVGAAGPWLRTRRLGSVAWPYFDAGAFPRRADEVSALAVDRYRALHPLLLDRGFYLPPSAHEVWFLSTAHDPADLDRLGDALGDAVAALGPDTRA